MDDVIQLLVSAILGGGTVGLVLLASLETWGRKHFAARDNVLDGAGDLKLATKGDMTGAVKRLQREIAEVCEDCERNSGLFVALDDRVGDLEQKTALLEERQSQQWERISDQMSQTARTIRDVTTELKEISQAQHEFALRLERGNSR